MWIGPVVKERSLDHLFYNYCTNCHKELLDLRLYGIFNDNILKGRNVQLFYCSCGDYVGYKFHLKKFDKRKFFFKTSREFIKKRCSCGLTFNKLLNNIVKSFKTKDDFLNNILEYNKFLNVKCTNCNKLMAKLYPMKLVEDTILPYEYPEDYLFPLDKPTQLFSDLVGQLYFFNIPHRDHEFSPIENFLIKASMRRDLIKHYKKSNYKVKVYLQNNAVNGILFITPFKLTLNYKNTIGENIKIIYQFRDVYFDQKTYLKINQNTVEFVGFKESIHIEDERIAKLVNAKPAKVIY